LDPTSQGSKLGDAGWPRVVGFNGDVVGLNGARGGRERRQVGTAWQRHEREREGAIAGMHKREEKAPFGKDAKASWAG
jgi:hypothetical protein